MNELTYYLASIGLIVSSAVLGWQLCLLFGESSTTPTHTHEYRIGETRTVITIHPDGHITLAEGVTLDEASRLFWEQMERSAPGTCERIMKERKERP